ncbi:MAG: urea carboxylase-associated family protein [Alphaproteobacteria bacterium]|jgi:uncharacterized protein|nr:urea carboxylase-associated family protein [Rhodospirillaceae bacterium]MBT6512548.1 urea carboxylase-associated family protein [Rhodospirillaceae bacterium]MBT7614280.1 urea carboxylase-associated family protein [Rhodospirillaceae bacterium]MBT7648390.1 urea carboxylase-associated family protein [Rhodospirillaceae bacterium]MDG2480249.1 urea carboxylase-associated family protein [Alphaproteobacteria bacterium]
MGELQTVPASGGKAAHVKKGQHIKIINTHGEQVVDTWAFNAEDTTEYMAMDATRAYNQRMSPLVGDHLVTYKRRPILTLVEDTSPGRHDTQMAACDQWRYHLLGVEGYHKNCADNLSHSMGELGAKETHTPAPLNLFMNIPWQPDGTLSFDPPLTKAGDYVVLRAEIDCIVAMSSCPQDLLPINGTDGKPTEAHFEVY